MSLNIPCVLSWAFCNNAVLCDEMTPTMLVPRLGVSCVTVWHIVHIFTTTDNRFPHLTTSHTSQTTPSWAAVRGGCWLLLTAGLVCSVQGVHCTVCQHRQPALYCTVLYSTHVLCTPPHTQYTGHQPPYPYTAGFKLKISVNGHKLNYNCDTEGWL